MHTVEIGYYLIFTIYCMFNYLREERYQKGCCDRDRGLLPRTQDSAYLDGYFSDRPEGLDGIIQYFPSLESYLKWKFKSHKA